MSTDQCRWGFLSSAEIGKKNWQAIKNSGNGKVVAVASRRLAKSEEYIAECQAACPFAEQPRAVEGYEALLASDDIDAVYIPLPTGLRKEWVIAAAKAGKHVMCEKPCAVSASDLQEMIDACAEAGVQFMDGVMYMHSARLEAMRKVLDDGESIGEIRRIATQFSFNAPDEFKEGNIRTNSDLEPQGCLGDLGWYTIRFALWAMKYEMPVRVRGNIIADFHREDSPSAIPMQFSGELEFEGGVTCGFYNSFMTDHQQWANISGTKGYLLVSDYVLPFSGDQLGFQVSKSDFNVQHCDFRMDNQSSETVTTENANSAVDAQETKLFRKFSELVLGGTPDDHWPKISLMTQQLMDACLKSARDGGRTIEM